MPKLNPNAQKWVDALRSGNYKQGESQLKIDDDERDIRHCCLGVLCEVAVQEGVIDEFDSTRSYLPQEVMAWGGLKSERANYRDRKPHENSEGGSLVQLNDSGKTFSDIASFIEKYAVELGVAGRETELAEVGQ